MLDSQSVREAFRVGKRRVALLVDGENLGVDHAQEMLSRAGVLGQVTVRCVFGNVRTFGGWCEAAGFRVVHTDTAKNAADLRLAIEALDLAHAGRADAFVLATSDRDFTHLVHYLVERGYPVVGIGKAATSEALKRACTEFHALAAAPSPVSEPAPAPGPVPTPPKVVPQPPVRPVDRSIHRLLELAIEGDGWLSIQQLGSQLKAQYGHCRKDTGCADWTRYFEPRKSAFEIQGSGAARRVRLRHRKAVAP